MPPRPQPTPTLDNVDPQNCHRTLHEHRQATKQKYRRMVREQMREEEAFWTQQHQQGLEPFPYDAFDMKQPLLPALDRAMDESGGDAARAWQICDKRSLRERVADEVANEKREDEVRRRADEMMRNDREAKEDEAMRELLEELPTFKCPDINNTIPLASLIGNIQERIPAPISDITISPRSNPHLQLGLSQVLSWIRKDCHQENLEHVFLVSVDELDRYCSLIADRIYHHLSADFKKSNYLNQLRNSQTRLRRLKQVNSELQVENERLKSGVEINNQVENNLERVPLWVHQQFSKPFQNQRLNSDLEISDNQAEYNRGRVKLFGPSVQRSYSPPPEPQRLGFQLPQMDWTLQRRTAIPIPQNGRIPEMNDMEYSIGEMEEIRYGRRDAKRAHSMPPHNIGRTRTGDFHTTLPKPDPVAGYGTVVAVDEIGPRYDYSDLEVSMRGGAGNPYSQLEDSDFEGDYDSGGKAAHFVNVTSSLGKGTLERMKTFAGDDDDDDDSFSNHSNLKFTKQGDTKSNDPNNRLWGGGLSSSSGIGGSSGIPDNPAGPRNDRHQGRRRKGPGKIAPGLAPFKPKVDPYAEVPRGFQFSWNQAEIAPLKKTWTTLDPKTGVVKYEEGNEEAQEDNPPETYMWNPSDARNTPLAATFGTSRVVFAAEAKENKAPEPGGLTEKSLQRLERQSRRDRAESIDDYIDISSTPGSPNAPPSEPSVVEYHTAMPQGSTVTDETIHDQPIQIDANVRKNFMDNVNAMHDARPAPTTFELRNQGGWLPTNKAAVTYINEFGEGNVVEVKMKTEERTRKMNERGEYDGEDLGQVKKRYRRGFSEMFQARDVEILRASKEYFEWKAMPLEDRMELLTLIRQPIDLWNDKLGADDDDQHELHYLPKFYERRISRRKEKQRMRAILADKAKQKQKDNASTSLGTAETGDTLDTWGVLGDCDDLPVRATSTGSRTPRVGDESLPEMFQRAVDLGKSRDSRSPSRSRSSSKSASVAGSMVAKHGSKPPKRAYNDHRSKPRPRQYSGGSATGNSVAGPHQPRPPSSYPSPSPAASSTSWCAVDNGSDAPSTVRGLRNALLNRHIFNGSGTDRSSDGTNAADGLAELIAAYDDSPTLRIPMDTDIPSPPLTEAEQELYDYGITNMGERGRVVTVRLHAVKDSHTAQGNVLPRFTPGAIANKVFGGVVQEFQLHPAKRTAVVVFVHPREARSFVHHVRNVREKGTGHAIRELQIEASWFKGAESQAILPAQPNLLKHSISGTSAARRCILLSYIPKDKSNRVVFQELSECFGTILVRTSLITPPQNYVLGSEGKQALVEFANLQEALRAYDDLNKGLIAGYENSNPQFMDEPTEKRAIVRDYCGCLGCDDKRTAKSKENEAKKRKRNEQMLEDEEEMSSYDDTASE
ncbi:hypothetical protein VF21_09458 [Pseudogymnoascus sp. 05NY08]|nr:hypothetical protein VF21_09458 [Pseudogymnoascus sp. 05NY08]